MIYFIRAGETGPIKIGHSRDPRKRLAQLQTGHSEVLTIIAVMDGDEAEEEALHKAFSPSRGEWCDPTSGLLAYIAAYALPIIYSQSMTRERKIADKETWIARYVQAARSGEKFDPTYRKYGGNRNEAHAIFVQAKSRARN